MMEKRRGEEATKKEHKEEEIRRRVSAKATMEENPDALRNGKWPRCTQ